MSVIWQKGESQNGGSKNTKQVKFSKKPTFFIPDSYMSVSVGIKRSFFGKFGLLCFLDTSVLRFTYLLYYWRHIIIISVDLFFIFSLIFIVIYHMSPLNKCTCFLNIFVISPNCLNVNVNEVSGFGWAFACKKLVLIKKNLYLICRNCNIYTFSIEVVIPVKCHHYRVNGDFNIA